MALYDTRVLVEELKAVLVANIDIVKVSTDVVTPVASEDAETAVYISVENIGLEPARTTTTGDGYDRHMLVNLYCNYDGTTEPLGVYDFIDSVEKCILADNGLWTTMVDRDIIAVDFDNQANAPRRSITMLLDIAYRKTCV